MIDTARRRMRAKTRRRRIEFRVLATEHLSGLGRGELFDGAFSNFSGLNCVADLHLTADQLAGLLTRRAPVLICLSTRYCIAEMPWFVLHGQFRKAFRRTSGFATVRWGSLRSRCTTRRCGQSRETFSPYFRLRWCTGIGIAVPPSYLEPMVRKHPRVLNVLRAVDRAISPLPWFRTVGDHILICFERVEESCC